MIYVVLAHDVWNLGKDPGHENEFGEPETTTIDAVFDTRDSAQAFVDRQMPVLDGQHFFYTIEEHEVRK